MAKLWGGVKNGKVATSRDLKGICKEDLPLLGWQELTKRYDGYYFSVWRRLEVNGEYTYITTRKDNPLEDCLEEQGYIKVKDALTNDIYKGERLGD